MTGRKAVTTALALGMFATLAAADNAVRRDGSSSGGSQNSGGRQPSAHSGSSGSGGSSYSGGGQSGGGSQATPAQRRQPRPGTGTGGHGGYYHHGGGYYPYYPYGGYYPYYGWPYGGFYGSFGYGYYGGGYYPYGGAAYHYGYSDRGSLRILVDQSKARVYVDGYYAGTVDDYDGLFQRLYTAPGRHEIAFKLEGYVTHRIKVYVASDATLKIHHDMVKGTGPDTLEDLAGDVDDRYARRDDERYDRRDPARDEDQDADDERPAPRMEEPRRRVEASPRAEAARLRLSVLPEDASIYLDGQFKGSARQAGSLDLPPGRHRLEVVRPGFRTEERDVDLEPGASRQLEIELQRP